MMDEIFKRASLVLVWLGENPQSNRLANRGIPPYPSSPIRHHFTSCPDWRNRSHRSALLQILSQPYWERLWVVQEFLLAREVLLFFGDQYFWGQDLYRSLDALDDDLVHRNTNASRLVYAKFSGDVNRYRLFSQSAPSLKILKELILEWKAQECGDVRDKIFAFLGLAQHMSATDDDIMVRPDYEKPVEDIFADFVRLQIALADQADIGLNDNPLKLDTECQIIGLQILGLRTDHPVVRNTLGKLWDFTELRLRRISDMLERRPGYKMLPMPGE
jgi:hypothetical protein